MDLQRLRELAGLNNTRQLTESTEADMQIASTVGRDQSYAEFDQSQDNVDDRNQSAWSEYNQTDEAIDLADNSVGQQAWYIIDNGNEPGKILSGPYDTRQEANRDALGMQWFDQNAHSIEFGIDDDGVFVDDDSTDNDFFVDESVPAIDSCNQGNPENADLACAMEEEFDSMPENEVSANIILTDEALNYWGDRYNRLVDSFVEPYKAMGMIKKEMANQGYEQHEIDEVIDSVEDAFGEDQYKDAQFGGLDDDTVDTGDRLSDDMIEYEDVPFDESWHNSLNEGYGNYAKVHDLRGMDHKDVYDQTQTDDSITDGDVIIADGATAVMCKAFPVLISGTSNEFHSLKPGISFADYDNGHYEESEMLAQDLAQKNGIVEEDFNLQNGYDEFHCADGEDYFPTGADGPVTKDVGPSGARQGDNPEQKRMQVAETHKELVYAYRNYLNESKSK
jgi:hypothetical protein